MPFQPGIVTRAVTVGGSSTAESAQDLVLEATLSAVVMCEDGSTRPASLIWEATGWRYESAPETTKGAAGEQVSFEPPVSDQPGWRDGEIGFILDVSAPGTHTHLYVIELVTRRGWGELSRRIIGPFALPTEDLSPVDADALVDVPTVAGTVVSVPDSWSAQVAQAVAAAGSADAAAASASAASADRIAAAASASAASADRIAAAASASDATASALSANAAADTATEASDLAVASAALAGIEITPSPDYPGSVLRVSYPAHVSPAPHLIRLPIGVSL